MEPMCVVPRIIHTQVREKEKGKKCHSKKSKKKIYFEMVTLEEVQ